MNENGWTVIYFPIDDDFGLPRVAGRFKTDKEKDEFLRSIYKNDSGWTNEEIEMIQVIHDYNYHLPR